MKKIFYITISMGFLFITSCDKKKGCTDAAATNYNSNAQQDDGSCTYNNACVKQVVNIGNTGIQTATTWDSCHIYHLTNSAPIQAPLTIEAGTIVKFDAGCALNVLVDGGLTVNGTGAAPVIFTSSKDDSYGGDTNGDGSATYAAKGNWKQINLGNSSNNHLDHCKIFYAGSGSVGLERALMMDDGDNNSLTNSVIAQLLLLQPPNTYATSVLLQVASSCAWSITSTKMPLQIFVSDTLAGL